MDETNSMAVVFRADDDSEVLVWVYQDGSVEVCTRPDSDHGTPWSPPLEQVSQAIVAGRMTLEAEHEAAFDRYLDEGRAEEGQEARDGR